MRETDTEEHVDEVMGRDVGEVVYREDGLVVHELDGHPRDAVLLHDGDEYVTVEEVHVDAALTHGEANFHEVGVFVRTSNVGETLFGAESGDVVSVDDPLALKDAAWGVA